MVLSRPWILDLDIGTNAPTRATEIRSRQVPSFGAFLHYLTAFEEVLKIKGAEYVERLDEPPMALLLACAVGAHGAAANGPRLRGAAAGVSITKN